MNNSIPVWRGSANVWECDEMGHMNVRFYLAKAAEGIEVLWRLLGPGDGVGFTLLEQHIRYHREVRAGTGLTIRAGLLEITESRLEVYFEMRRAYDDVLCATLVSVLGCIDAATGRPGMLRAADIQRAAAWRVDLPAAGRPKGLTIKTPVAVATLAEADRMGLVEITRTSIQPNQIDRDGALIPYHLMGMVSDGIAHLLIGLNPARAQGPAEGGMGGAALEYRFVYRRPARLGDALVVRSGVIAVTDKVQVFGHWILDLVTGEAIATAEAVAVGFDLKTRKIAALPAETLLRMRAAIIPGLSA